MEALKNKIWRKDRKIAMVMSLMKDKEDTLLKQQTELYSLRKKMSL